MEEKDNGFRIINIEDLILDRNNPRLPESYKGSTEKEIINYMLLDASLIELMLAIGKNDFFKGEQLLVVHDKTSNKYRVIEGNRRLSALKILNNPELADYQKTKIDKVLKETTYRPTEIPCLIFNEVEEISKYLGYRHITGIKEWKLLEKASYLSSIWRKNYSDLNIDEASRELAKSIGSRKDYVKRILIGYIIFTEIKDQGYYRIQGLDDTSFHFNYIADSLNKRNISNFIGVSLEESKDINEIHLNDENLKKWTHWFFEKNKEGQTRLIGDSRTLQKLNIVLSNKESSNQFVNNGLSLDNALDLTEDNIEQFYSSLDKATKNLEYADNLIVRIIDRKNINVNEKVTIIKRLIKRIENTLNEETYD